MRVGIVGAGYVGAACAKAMLLRGSCQEIVLLDTRVRRAKGVAADLSHAAVLYPGARVASGSWEGLAGADLVVVTAGINEKAGRATDKSDQRGRLLLLPDNAKIYADIIPRVAAIAPLAPILVVTDPPDALADVARTLTTSNEIISTGTFLDSLRFRLQIATQFDCDPASVHADVIGEHGTSQVYVWSSARIGGENVLNRANREGRDVDQLRRDVETKVRHANIDIIKGTDASQHGIGVVTARLTEAILRDEGFVEPIGTLHPVFGVTLSLPSVIGRGKPVALNPDLDDRERDALDASAKAIKDALSLLDDEQQQERPAT